MVKFFKINLKTFAKPPGTLIHVDEDHETTQELEELKIKIVNYNEERFEEKDLEDLQLKKLDLDKSLVTWVKIDGKFDPNNLMNIGVQFDLHPLLLEDILDPGQRPKMDDYGNYFSINLKMIDFNPEKKEVSIEPVSIILGENYVLSFQEKQNELFNTILTRIRTSKGRIRKRGGDYLAYALMDIIVDNYFFILENFAEKIEDLETELVMKPTRETLQEIHTLKRDLIILRKSIWPLREVLSSLQRRESQLIKDETIFFLRDIYDHTIQIIDTVESFRDMVSGMLDIYLSSISNRMNEIMKVLTIVATIFIPLTFIVGLYGMNFHFMPELGWIWGYPIIIIIMLIVSLVMVIYFKRKNWL